MTQWFAVMYPTTALTNINSAVRVEECLNEAAAWEKVKEWKKERPQCRSVVRREQGREEASEANT